MIPAFHRDLLQLVSDIHKCNNYNICIYIYTLFTWNPNDHCFDWNRPCFGGFNHPNNREQTGSRYI